MYTVIGIDVGASGGIAHFANGEAKAVKMPKTVEEMAAYFKYLNETYENCICFVEKVSSWNSDFNQGGKNFGIEKMMKNFTELKTCLSLVGIPFVQVHPISWQSTLSLRKKGEDKKQRKNRYKAAAGNYYPNIKPTLWNADAFCILRFGQVKLENDPDWVFDKLPPAAKEKINFNHK